MIIFDIHFGRFSILAIHDGGDRHKDFGFTHEPGEIIIDTPFVSLFFTNNRRARPPVST